MARQNMSDIVHSSLKTSAKGTMLVFGGSIGTLLLAFATKVLIVRYTTQEEFGIYALAISVVSILTFLAQVGLQEGSPRYISFFLGKGDNEKAKGVIDSSLKIVIPTSLMSFFVLYIFADAISNEIFKITNLAEPLKVISLSIPFGVLSGIIIAIFRGFKIIKPKVYFRDLARPLIFLLLSFVFIEIGLPFISIIYAYLFSVAIESIFLSAIAHKKLNIKISRTKPGTIKKELLFFSIPILSTNLMGVAIGWTDTLLLGYFRSAEDVAFYNVALTLAKMLILPLMALSYIYIPIASQLYAKDLVYEMKRTYQVLTKWIFSVAFPVFIIFSMFPETVISSLFGERYVGAVLVLRLLSIGFIFHIFMGLNNLTLLVLGRSKILMWVSVIVAGLNILLNYSLIPLYGIVGAALATTVSYLALNIMLSIKLYQYSRIHPLTPQYFKPVFTSLIIAVIINYFGKNISTEFWMLPLFLGTFIVIYIISLLVTKSVDDEDLMILSAFEEKTGKNLGTIKKIIKKFS
jgi:O-antigen/teichoic acid export membrane protein